MRSRIGQALFPAAFVAASLLAACGGDDGDGGSSPKTISSAVSIDTGKVEGNAPTSDGIHTYRGIAYASAPVGELRWKAPQALAAWADTRPARDYGATCWNSNPFGGAIVTTGVSEDCLFLNVTTGAKTTGDKQPVMVWIHGGGFVFGNGNIDATKLATKGVVVVSLNYRLGPFGFLAHPALTAEDPNRSSGAYGFLDMQAALKWVQRNIEQFGGDPQNVTVFGESAGSHAIGILMASPLSKGLFQKAIGESGAFWESEHAGLPRQLAGAEKMGLALGQSLGASTAPQLRAVNANALQSAANWSNINTDPGLVVPAPLIDGHALPQQAYDVFATGKQMDIPILVGWNEQENSIFRGRGLPSNTAEQFKTAAAARFGASLLPEFLSAYPATTDAQAKVSADTLIGDQIISYQTWAWAGVHRKTSTSPAYVYNFNPRSNYLPAPNHADEIPWVFNNLGPSRTGVQPSATDIALSDQMSSYWVNFAAKGNPNGQSLPAWPTYNGPGSPIMYIGNTTAMSSGAGPEVGTARFQFLHKAMGR